MQAVQFNFSYVRYGLGLALGGLFPSFHWSGLTTTVQRDVPVPALPGPDWALVRTRLGGICGTDLGAIYLHTSPYLKPFSGDRFTFGHENVGTIAELGAEIKDWQPGQRVLVEPTLWCAPRGYAKEDWCPYCAQGEINRCEHYASGSLSPGVITGTCDDTGGTWSQFFLAHASQLYPVPESLSDENVLMVEPFACAVHSVLVDPPSDEEKILLVGAGTIGLVTLAALRALGSKAHISVSARYDFQEEAARRLGADEVLRSADLYAEAAQATNAKLFKPPIGKRVVLGGYDRVYECVGSDATLDDSLRLARNGGTVIIVGIPGLAKGIDWTAVYSQELTVIAADRYSHSDNFQGEKVRTFNLALKLMDEDQLDLSWLVSRKYPLKDYKRTLSELANKRQHPIIKAVFEFPSTDA